MTHEDGALWLCFAIGLIAGWAWRGRAERKSRATDLPQWMARLGKAIAAQCYRVDEGHRFAGDVVTVSNSQTYEAGDSRYVVTVARAKRVTIDQ